MSLQLADAEVGDISDIINTELYPIHDSGHVQLQALIEHARAELAEDGCCLLKNFLRPAALEQARLEGLALSGKTFYSVRKVNAYFTEDDTSLPHDDPRRTFMERTSGFVTRDMIAPDAIIHRLYVSPMMKRFIGACLNEPEIFEYADPFAGLVINVMPDGTEQPWHFDTNEFI
ncbi:MAG: HalD/BesD family halogenase, partial [Pseudomonas sp.]